LREEVYKPREAEDKVCNDSKVVELNRAGRESARTAHDWRPIELERLAYPFLIMVRQLIPQEAMFGAPLEQVPIHEQIPNIRVRAVDSCKDDKDCESRIMLRA
jgi:hypothetical protein